MGVTAEGLTHLDQFRLLITQIGKERYWPLKTIFHLLAGNCLGYVHLMRTANMHHNATKTATALDVVPSDGRRKENTAICSLF